MIKNIEPDDSIAKMQALQKALAESYDFQFPILHGGQGDVYAAKQRGTNRLVAIKVMRGDDSRRRLRFDREIELSSRLDHPGIVRVLAAGVAGDVPYYVMEYISGGTSIAEYSLLKDLTPKDIVRQFVKVCRAVHHAHQRGVIHRDLSHSNVLVGDNDEPRVSDFGLARDAESDVNVTGDSIVGTPPYLSPEQLGFGDATIDVRSDVYSLGILLYKLLSDDYPYSFSGEIFQDRDRVLFQNPQPLRGALKDSVLRDRSSVDRDLETITAMATAKEKERRYQSAGDFANDLDRWLRGEAVVARGDSSLYIFRKFVRKHRAVVSAAGLGLVLACIFWFQLLQQRNIARDSTAMVFEMFNQAYDVEDAFRSLPGGLAVREQFVNRLATGIFLFQEIIDKDAAFMPIRASLLEMRGDLAAEQGDAAEATELLHDFLTDSLSLAESDPNNFDQVARAYRKLAEITGDEQLFVRGVDWGKRTVNRFPSNKEVHTELCKLHLSFGERLAWANDHARAVAEFDQAAAICDERAESSKEWTSLSANVKQRRGVSLLALGLGEEGLATLDSALEMRKQIADENPVDVQAKLDLMSAYSLNASALKDEGEAAVAHYQAAIELGEQLRMLDPDRAEVGFTLYACYHRLASIRSSSGDLDEAERLSSIGVSLARQLAEVKDRKADGLSTLAFAQMLSGELLLAQNKTAEAYNAFLPASDIRKELLAQDPNDLLRMQRAAVAQSWLGKTARKMHDFRLAIRHYSEAYDLFEKLHARQPERFDIALSFTRVCSNLAAAFIAEQTPEDDKRAAQLLDQAKRILEEERAAERSSGHESEIEALFSAVQTNMNIIAER